MRSLRTNLSKSFLIFLLLIGLSSCSIKNIQPFSNTTIATVQNQQELGKKIFSESWEMVQEEYLDETYNHQDWNKWKNRYINNIKSPEDAYVAIDTMLESLNDPYTRFLPPSEYSDQNMSIDAKLYGIGVNISDIKNNIVIVNVINGTPAKKSGLQTGDIILKVNQTSISGMSLRKVVDMVRGKAGTDVKLTILRDKQKLVKNIKREEINLKSVEYKILDNKYAYIKIINFISQDTAIETLKAIKATDKTEGVILDLRGNTGGLLPNAVLIANMFIEKGNIVSIVDKDGNKEVLKTYKTGALSEKPLVVLIDGGSASASEILGGALKDHKRATLVGTKSFGKGLVQRIHDLPNKTGINITIAKYLTPNGNDINKIGIAPDYYIEMTKEDFLKDRDPQLKKAEQVLGQKIAFSHAK